MKKILFCLLLLPTLLSAQRVTVDSFLLKKQGSIPAKWVSAKTFSNIDTINEIQTLYNHNLYDLKNVDTTTRTKILTRKATDSLINYALTGTVDTKGDWSIAGGLLPSVGVKTGDKWTITNGTVVLGVDSFKTNDIIIAKIDNPGQTLTNWNHIPVDQPKSVNLVLAGSSQVGAIKYNGRVAMAGSGHGGTNLPIVADTAYYNYSGTFRPSKLQLTNTTANTTLSISNQSTGFGVYINNITTGNGIDMRNGGGGKTINIQNTSTGSAVSVDNLSTGRALQVVNNSSGNSIDITNSGGGYGLRILNSSNGFGVLVTNSSTSYGIDVSNTSSGYGLRVSNNNGQGVYITNTSGIGLTLYNQGSGIPLTINSVSNSANNNYNYLYQYKNAYRSYVDTLGYLHNSKPTFSSVFFDSTRVIELDFNTPKIISNAWGNLWPNSVLVGFTENKDTAIVGYTGNYNMTFDFNCNVSVTASFRYHVKKRAANSTSVTTIYRKKVSNAGTTVNRAMSINWNFTAGDRVWIEVENITNGSDITVYGGAFSITANYLNP